MAHAKAYIAVTAPTVNSYKRLKVGDPRSGATWAPAYVSYGYNNRTQMLRVPAPGRVEDRTVDGSCNPYLAATVLLAAGLDGIERELEPRRPEPAQPVRDRPPTQRRRARDRDAAGEPARRDARARARRRDPQGARHDAAAATTWTTSSSASAARCRPRTSRSRSGSSTATSSSSRRRACAGSSGCSRSRRRSRSASARTSARCSRQMADRGPDSAGLARLPRPGAAGRDEAVAVLRGSGRGLGGGRARLGADAEVARRGLARRGGGRRRRRRGAARCVRRAPPRPARHERRRADRDLQGDGRPARVRGALRARRHARARTGSGTRAWRPRAG